MNIILSDNELSAILSTTLLSGFEKDVLRLSLQGLGNTYIGKLYKCSEGKIRYTKKRIEQKIDNYLTHNVAEKYTIYKHIFPNGKVYIGMTQQELNKRWINGLGYRDNEAMFNDIVLYGWNNIGHEIIEEIYGDKSRACHREQELIFEHKSHLPEYGYNQIYQTRRGDGCENISIQVQI